MIQYIKKLFKQKPAPAKEEAKDVWAENIAAFEANWKLWTQQQQAHRKPLMVKEAYRTVDGAVYFEYADIGDIPVIRSQKAAEALLKLSYAVTPQYVEQLQKQIAKAVENKDTDKVLQLNTDFFNRYKIAPEIPTMVDLAALFFIRHDENPYSFNPIIHGQKLKAANTNYDLQAFFLDASWLLMQMQVPQLLKLWKIGNSKDFQDYLQGLKTQ